MSSSLTPSVDVARLVEVTPPDVEPLTVAEAKLHCKVDHSEDDALIGGFITAARRTFEKLTGRTLILTAHKVAWDAWPRKGTFLGSCAARELELPRAPLLIEDGQDVAVTAVKYLDPDGEEQTLDAGSYFVERTGSPDHFPRIRLNPSTSIPTLGDYPGALWVEFTAGYGETADDVPPEIKATLKLLIGHLYEERKLAVIGNIVNELPHGYQSMIEMHQIRTIA